jgi:hypothetical protein
MTRKFCPALTLFILGVAFGIYAGRNGFAKDENLKPEDVVAAYLKSIGSTEALAGAKNRGLKGSATIKFIQGGTGVDTGQFLMVSEGSNFGLIIKFDSTGYPGEHIAFDGSAVTVSNINPGNRSPLGDFIFRYSQIVKEGFFGGVLSTAWPLLDIAKKNPSLKYSSAKVEGRKLHALEYIPQAKMNDVKVKLFFEFDTFRHVRTEYKLRVRGERSMQPGSVTTGGIMDTVPDSDYLLAETFDNFREEKVGDDPAKSLMLPHSYALSYSVEGRGSSFLANWTMEATQLMHNVKLSPAQFKAP